MKLRSIILVSLCAVLVLSPRASAEGLLNDAQLRMIRGNCAALRQSLTKTHDADAVLRSNLTAQYDDIISKLMMPLNNRLVQNKMDATEFLSTTDDLQKKVAEFRSQYSIYERKLSSTIDMDCANQPWDFYQSLGVARDQRRGLGNTVHSINDLLKRYRSSVDGLLPKTGVAR